MNCNQVLSALKTLGARGMDFGTVRTRRLLDALGSPDEKLKTVHIAGTNGKGSVAEYVYRILLAAGKRVGKFTSPAVFDYFGQFEINGKPIDKKLYARAFGRAVEVGEKLGLGATSFEVETAGAFYAFMLAGCEYAVIECGLGGRDDATNAILKKEVAVITSIGLEHTAVLGSTLNEICAHKSGIIKGCPAVVSALQPEEAREYFECMRAAGANLKITEKPIYYGGNSFLYGGKEYETGMRGYAQPYNAAAAIEAARILKVDENAICSGVKAARLGGRIEVLPSKTGKIYILDGAHNPAAFLPLADFVKSEYGQADRVIFGSLADKDIDKNIEIIKSFTDKITIVPCDSLRNIDMEKLRKACVNSGIFWDEYESVAAALENATGGITVICGSFTILKEAKLWIEKKL